jgi:SAM-dependent methyltransferase
VGERARYDGVAEWYDRELATSEAGLTIQQVVAGLLGDASGSLLDIGCGGGVHAAALAAAGWDVTGVDVSEDQLRLARDRGVRVINAPAEQLPFEDASFDAAISIFTHTDVDDFAGLVREAARVLRPGTPFVYVGVHPCFVGPHSKFVRAQGVPELHPGYFDIGRYHEAPGISPEGLRARVGAVHLPLAEFVRPFLESALRLEDFSETALAGLPYPYFVTLRWRR